MTKKENSTTILTKNEIKQLLKEKKLLIDPILDEKQQIHDVSIDLRLDTYVTLLKPLTIENIDPLKQTQLPEYTEQIELDPHQDKLILHPQTLVIAQTLEYVKLPDNIYGILDGRSSLARLGLLIHATAASIDPNYEGHISFEIINLSKTSIILYPLMRVARLTLFKLPKPTPKTTKHKYDYNTKPQPSKISQDPDLQTIKKLRQNPYTP